MRICITGYRGFIGSYLYDALGDHDLVGLDLKDGLWGDAFHNVIGEVDVIYHLAAQTSVIGSLANPVLDAQANIMLTLQLIKTYPEARIIYAASGGASAQESIASPYGLSKKVAGEYLKLLHKDYVICNLSNVFGDDGKGVLERFISEDPITIYGDGEQTRDFVHVSDVVRGLCQALLWPKGEYFLGSDQPVRIIDIARLTGKPIQYKSEREGELYVSSVPNTAPNWKPEVTIEKYLNGGIKP